MEAEQGISIDEKKRRRRKRDKPSVFENEPREVSVDYRAGQKVAHTSTTPSVFEADGKLHNRSADFRSVEKSSIKSNPSIFESTPHTSIAQYCSSQKISPITSTPSIFESETKPPIANLRSNEKITNNSSSPSIFESTPLPKSTAHFSSNAPVSKSSESMKKDQPHVFESTPIAYPSASKNNHSSTSPLPSTTPLHSTCPTSPNSPPNPLSSNNSGVFESQPRIEKNSDFRSCEPIQPKKILIPQIFENVPKESTLLSSNKKVLPTPSKKDQYESEPKESVAHFSSVQKSSKIASLQSIFESNPKQSVANFSSLNRLVQSSASASVFENEPAQSRALYGSHFTVPSCTSSEYSSDDENSGESGKKAEGNTQERKPVGKIIKNGANSGKSVFYQGSNTVTATL